MSDSQSIIALDPAEKCGWAHSDGSHGVWRLVGHLGQQHAQLERELARVIQERGCALIASENAGFGSPNPAMKASHNERLGVVRLVAARFRIRVQTFQPSKIKMFATGSGNADKLQMIAACRRLLGIEVISDDEADAIWILELAKRPDCWVDKVKVKSKSKRRSRGSA